MEQHIFYQPERGVAADVIPFYQDGVFYLFYLYDARDPMEFGEGTPWCLLTTTDFVHFHEHGEVLPRGRSDEQDLYVYTGCAVRQNGRFCIYYTAHNPYFPAQRRRTEAIRRAWSDDLLHWKKDEEFSLYAPIETYEPNDWRDPFVFYDEHIGGYRMLLMACGKTGEENRRGQTASLTSRDGDHWTLAAPFFAPGCYNAHECPDFFTLDRKEYLLFSEFMQDRVTRYAMRKPGGEFFFAEDNAIDTAGFYAAKTVTDGKRRYAIGWIGTRENESDRGDLQWGGCLAVHEVGAREDGTLTMTLPKQVEAAFVKTEATFGDTVSSGEREFAAAKIGKLPDCCLVDLKISPSAGTHAVELLFRAAEEGGEGAVLRLNFDTGCAMIDVFPQEEAETGENSRRGFCRKIPTFDGKLSLKLVLDGTAGILYLEDETALSFRVYKNAGDGFYVNVRGGSVGINATVKSRPA